MLSINLLLVDALTMRRLNKKYRGLDKATTVLSFCYVGKGRQDNFPKNEGETECLGEIFICLSEAKKKDLTFKQLVNHGLKNLLSEIPASTDLRIGLNRSQG